MASHSAEASVIALDSRAPDEARDDLIENGTPKLVRPAPAAGRLGYMDMEYLMERNGRHHCENDARSDVFAGNNRQTKSPVCRSVAARSPDHLFGAEEIVAWIGILRIP
jgi:hypothetical protein